MEVRVDIQFQQTVSLAKVKSDKVDFCAPRKVCWLDEWWGFTKCQQSLYSTVSRTPIISGNKNIPICPLCCIVRILLPFVLIVIFHVVLCMFTRVKSRSGRCIAMLCCLKYLMTCTRCTKAALSVYSWLYHKAELSASWLSREFANFEHYSTCLYLPHSSSHKTGSVPY